jgi:succinate-acetate transporter protein
LGSCASCIYRLKELTDRLLTAVRLRAEIYRNNVFGGTVFSSYGGFWLGYGIFGMLVGGGVLEAPAGYARGVQMFLIIWGTSLSCITLNNFTSFLNPLRSLHSMLFI